MNFYPVLVLFLALVLVILIVTILPPIKRRWRRRIY
jgi:hypothetical protein